MMTSPYEIKKAQSQNFGHFFPDLCFIWLLPIFQFLVNALPNRMMTSPYEPKMGPPTPTLPGLLLNRVVFVNP